MAKFPEKWFYIADRGVAMDCNEVQAYLKFRTLGHENAREQDSFALKRHLAECDSCHRAFKSQQQFDREIARFMSDVEIPVGFADRLKNIVNTASVQPPVCKATAMRRRFSRRAAFAFAAIVPLLIIGWFTLRVPPLTDTDIRHLTELDVNLLPNASSSLVFPLPAGWTRVRGLQFNERPRLASIGSRQIPVLQLIVQLRSRLPQTPGFLVRLPRFRSQQPVEATSFSSATIQYSSFGSWVVWREGNAVFLCVLRDTHTMERLRNAIADGREVT